MKSIEYSGKCKYNLILIGSMCLRFRPLFTEAFTYLKNCRTFILTSTTEDIEIGSIVSIQSVICDQSLILP